MRHEPVLVHRIAMKSAAQLIVHAALGHCAQRRETISSASWFRCAPSNATEIVHRRPRKLGRAAEPAEVSYRKCAGTREKPLSSTLRRCGPRRAALYGGRFLQLLHHIARGFGRSFRGRFSRREAMRVSTDAKPGVPERFSGGKYVPP